MSWTLHRWTWVLEGPLFVGHVPAGALNRCRIYIPARAVWGAVTAEAARLAAQASPAYKDVGESLRDNARFTYLYPAQRSGRNWVAWLPRFGEDGLCWEREDRIGELIADRAFRRRLLSTRPGTAIDPASDSAADGSLRETECVCDRWRGESVAAGRVAYVGYVFTRSDEALQHVERPKRLFIGGDTRYGLGSLRVDGMERASKLFGSSVDLSEPEPESESKHYSSPSLSAPRTLAHASAEVEDCAGGLKGSREEVTGRDHVKAQKLGSLLWTPGSVFETRPWEIQPDGTWSHRGEER